MKNDANILPRLIRMRDAPRYLGMDKFYFNRDVRSHITVFRIGKQGIAFDRLDLDKWVEYCNLRIEHFLTSMVSTVLNFNALLNINEVKS